MDIKTLSMITGVSKTTVSNALNGKSGVSSETAEKIFAAAKEHGYFFEQHIKNIKLVLFRSSGILDNFPLAAFIESADKEIRRSGYDNSILNLNKHSTDFHSVLSKLLNDNSTAILLLGSEMTEEDAKFFAGAAVPVVIVDNWFDSLPYSSVLIDNAEAAAFAVKKLKLLGHRQIGYIKSSTNSKNLALREKGYRAGNASNGSLYTYSLTSTMEDSYREMKELLSSKAQTPSAFVIDNDIIALGAIRAFEESGYNIPKDISLISISDTDFPSTSLATVSMVKVFKEDLGKIAARRLIEIIETGDNTKLKIQLGHEFIDNGGIKPLQEETYRHLHRDLHQEIIPDGIQSPAI